MSYTDQPVAGNAPTFTLANWGKRVGSYLIDAVPSWILLFLGSILNGGKMGGVYYLFFLISLGYWVWNMVRQGRTGQSIGKSVIGTKLVMETTAAPVGPAVAIGRWLLHILDSIFLIGFLWPLWDKKRQTFADKILGTVVVEA